jgi:hypothetical protein
MANLKNIEKDRTEVIKDLKPNEMLVYMESLIANLYESFIEHNEEKALASRRLIEEATDLYIAKGYSNSHEVELNLRLDKANDVLTETLEAKQEQEIELSKRIVVDYYEELIDKVYFSNSILEVLIDGYSKEPSEVMLATIKEVAFRCSSNLYGIKLLLENHEDKIENEAVLYPDIIEIIVEQYTIFQKYLKKINSF